MKHIFTLLLLMFVLIFNTSAQTQDTLFIHKGEATFEFATKEVDSIIFYRTKPAVSLTNISLNVASATVDYGANLTLIPTYTPSNTTIKEVVWRSSNTAVATVNNGIVAAVAQGSATILAVTNDGHHAATCDITVPAPWKGDGPYIMYGAGTIASVTAFDRDTNMFVQNYPHRDSIGEIRVWSQEGNYTFTFRLHDITIPPARYTMPEQLVVISDPHGDIVPFVRVLQGNGVINQQLDWCYGQGHLMILGDVMDRGDDQVPIYWLIYKWEEQARLAGGCVHFIIGNHDVMVPQNDLRYLNAKYFTIANKMNVSGYDKLWTAQTELGRWLATRNTIEILGDELYNHAGLGPQVVSKGFTIEQINDTVRKYILLPNSATSSSPRAALIMGSNGPTWYREIAENALYEEELDDILDYFNVTKIFNGHTRVDNVSSYYNGKAYVIDISNVRVFNMNNGKSMGAKSTAASEWAINVSGVQVPFAVVAPPPPPPPPVVTPENIETYVQAPNVTALQAFLNGGTATYTIKYMCPRFELMRESYGNQFNEFENFTIVMPRGDYKGSCIANFETGAKWYRGPNTTTEEIFVAMSGANNPLCDVTVNIPRSTSGSTPPVGYNGATTGAYLFFTALQIATGYTIIQDGTIFWFRSKVDPSDWFSCVRK